eukprot:257165-Amphidinium_carterae.1
MSCACSHGELFTHIVGIDGLRPSNYHDSEMKSVRVLITLHLGEGDCEISARLSMAFVDTLSNLRLPNSSSHGTRASSNGEDTYLDIHLGGGKCLASCRSHVCRMEEKQKRTNICFTQPGYILQ